MRIYIEIVDVVANAFFNLIKHNKRHILYQDLEVYGAKVVELLNENDENEAVFIVSKESKQALVDEYTDYFEEYEEDNKKGLKIKDNIGENDIYEKFCLSISRKVLSAFCNAEIIQAIL